MSYHLISSAHRKIPQDGAIALTLASAEGHVPIVALLIAAKAEINYVGAVSHHLVYIARDVHHLIQQNRISNKMILYCVI
jgi:hypothetical protein